MRLLSLLVAILVASILSLSLCIRAIVIAAAATFLVRLVLIEGATKDASRCIQEAAETALFLLLLVLTRGGKFEAGVLLNEARNGATCPLEDGIGSSAGNLCLKGFRLAIQFAHLKLATASMAVPGIVDTLLMVVPVLDAISGKLAAVVLALVISHALPPVLDGFEDETTGLAGTIASHVALSRMVQHTRNDAVTEAVYVDVVIVNGLHNLRYDPVQRLGCRAAGNLVENLQNRVRKLR